MPLAPILLHSQDPPPVFGLPYRVEESRESLLGNSGLQKITLEVSKSNLPTAGRQRAFRRLAPTVAERRDIVQDLERARLEFRWLAENRGRYAGRWIALEGDRLLAVGDSAREVYTAIANHEGTPLVTRVEPVEQSYFAGW